MKRTPAAMLLALTVCILLAAPSIADPADICEGSSGIPSSWFYDKCQRLDPPQACYDYILGFMQGSNMTSQLLTDDRQLLCPPAGRGTAERALAIVLGFMQAYPEERETCALQRMVTMALLREWRCKEFKAPSARQE